MNWTGCNTTSSELPAYYSESFTSHSPINSPINAVGGCHQPAVVNDGGATDVRRSKPAAGTQRSLPWPRMLIGLLTANDTRRATPQATAYEIEVVEILANLRHARVSDMTRLSYRGFPERGELRR